MTTGFCFTVNFYVKKVRVKSFSCVLLFATPWTVAYQVPLSVGFSRQKYWSRLPFPSPGDLRDPGIEPGSPAFHTDSLLSATREAPDCSYLALFQASFMVAILLWEICKL